LTVTNVETGLTYSTIQAAVNAASAGNTLQASPGTYTEQVTIGKSLTLEGTGPGVIVQSPSTLTADTLGVRAVMEVNSAATVNISDLTVQGPVASGQIIDAGILVVGGATADVSKSTIADIRSTPITGVGNTGNGIQVGGTASLAVGEVGHATITDSTIMDYQKRGISAGGTGSTVTIMDNTITGVGGTAAIGQNGVVIFPGATSTITGNTISNNQYTGASSGADPFTNTQAAGILDLGGGADTITGNTVSTNDIGIFITNAGATISGNTLHDTFEGILLGAGTATVSTNMITGNNIGVAIMAFATDSFGNPVTTDAQGTLLSNDITNNGNGSLSFPGGGIRLLVGTGATTTANATVNFNRIVDNSVGMDNTTSNSEDATLNWWGGNAGPNQGSNETTTGTLVVSPWLVLGVSAAPTTIGPGGTAVVTADLTKDSDGATHSTAPFFPDGVPITFGATGGTITPTSVPTASGKASSNFTGTSSGTASATLDNETVNTSTISVEAINFPSPITTPEAGQATENTAFSLTFDATGGAGGFTYAVAPTTRATGGLPPGLTLNPTTGVLSGTPTTPGTFDFTVVATDVSGATASVAATIVVNQVLVITPTTPSEGVVGTSYSLQLSTTGGTAPVTFALPPGSTLPPGLALSPAGLISGIPTADGTFPFTISATDNNGAVASLPLSILVVSTEVAPPTVQLVQRFGFHAQPTTFVLTFSTALDPVSAEDVANYQLNQISGKRIGRAIPIAAAVYDPTTNTVTLETTHQVYLFARYRLVVNGSTPTGVAGATGLLLDGLGNGKPGSDFVTTFGKEILAGRNDPPRRVRQMLHHRSVPTTTHASPHHPTGSRATSTHKALSAAAVDAVLNVVVVPKKHRR
jgi:parallel beta-helix repeat protein